MDDAARERSPDADGGENGQAGLRRPVVFIHIPRTAGSSLENALRLGHGAGYVQGRNFFAGVQHGRVVRKGAIERDPARIRRLATLLAPEFLRASLVQTHMPLALRGVCPPSSRFVTILRDPAARSVSHYYYFLRRANEGSDSSPETTLAHHLGGARKRRRFDGLAPDNLQTRMLSGMPLDAPKSSEMLDAAKRNLRELDVVGITERFEMSLALLHLRYEWDLFLPPNRKVNTSKLTPTGDVLDADLEAARGINELDQALYAEGLELFDRAVSEFGERADVDAGALGRGWDLLSSGSTPSDGEGLSTAVDERAREILMQTQTKLADELAEACRQADLFVRHAAMLAEMGTAIVEESSTSEDSEAPAAIDLRYADKAAEGLVRHSKSLKRAIRHLGAAEKQRADGESKAADSAHHLAQDPAGPSSVDA